MVLKRNTISVLALLVAMIANSHDSFAQGFNGDKVAFVNFVSRMYENNPFEGVKIVEDYDDAYIISVVSLSSSNYPSESTMTRVAEVKSRAQASRYINGAGVTLDMIVTTKEDGKGNVSTEIVEKIHEGSFGYVDTLELLTILNKNEQTIYVYSTKLKKK